MWGKIQSIHRGNRPERKKKFQVDPPPLINEYPPPESTKFTNPFPFLVPTHF